MLLDFRNNLRGVAFGITIVIALIFALTGTGSLFLSTPDSESAIVVNGADISEREVNQATARERARILNSNPDMDRSLVEDESLRPQAMRQLIYRELLIQAAKAQDLGVDPALISDLILDIEQFQTDGKFDEDRFRYAIRSQGYTSSSKFTEMLTDQFLVEQLSNGIINSSFVTDSELTTLIALAEQKRSFDYARLALKPFKDSVALTDTQIAEYYEENLLQYMTERKLSIEYIELNSAMLLQDQEVTEEDIQARFEQEKQSTEDTKSLRAAHILLGDANAELIAEVQSKIDAGDDFAQLAKDYSEDVASAENGGDLGFTTGDTFPETFEDALAALEVGQVSAPVETDSGTHFVKLLEIEKTEFLFEEQSERIAQELKQEAADSLMVEKLENLKEMAFNADNLQEVAEDLALVANVSEPFTVNGGAGIASSAAVVNAAYSPEVADDGYASEVLDLGDDNYVVLKLKEDFPSRQQSLEEVKANVTSSLTNSIAQTTIDAKAEEIQARLTAGASIKAVADEFDLEITSVDAGARNNAQVDSEVNAYVFELPTPRGAEVKDGFNTANGDFVAVQLSEVVLADTDVVEEVRVEQIRSIVEASTRNKEFSSYQETLIDQASIKQ
jgi:peptidyl-prolyl cis-trans isomerase D